MNTTLTATTTTRYIYTCTVCKAVHARDYRRYIGGKNVGELYRKDADGSHILQKDDGFCTICGKFADGARVKGTVTDHICGARCTGATGHECDCSCGGRNHGNAHLA